MKHFIDRAYQIVWMVMVLFVSCSDRWNENQSPPTLGQYTVLAKTNVFKPGETEVGVEDMHVCIFRDGMLSEVQTHLQKTNSGYPLTINKMSGNMYVLANTENLVDLEMLKTSGISEEQWLKTIVSGTEPVQYFTGKVDLNSVTAGDYTVPVTLIRGVARFDVEIFSVEKLTVDKIVFTGLMHDAYFLSQNSVITPEHSSSFTDTVNFSTPVEHYQKGIMYVYEQKNPSLTVAVTISVAGKTYVKEVRLPEQIKRNTAYSIIVTKETFTSEITLEIVEWDREDDLMLVPDFASPIMVDVNNSILSDDVQITDNGRTVVLPYTDVDCRLALQCAEELHYVQNRINGFSVEPIMEEDGVTSTNTYRIRKDWWKLGVPGDSVFLQFKRKGLNGIYPDDRITVVFTENPTKIAGLMNFAQHYEYDFAKYIDNELGRLQVPAGKRLTVEFMSEEDPWIKLVPTLDNSGWIRVVAGWKPNDRSANGRKQSARLVLANDDGSQREEYTVVRRNWGLPVTKQGDIWWCKYNAMGNSRDFADQILPFEDPASLEGKTVFEYLATCSPEQYFELWKWGYQGNSGQGLQVKEIDGAAKMEGFRNDIKVHMNTLESTDLAPDGYEIPSFDDFGRLFHTTSDYVWIMWDGSHISPWNGGTTIQRRNKRRKDVVLGNLVLEDLFYMAMYENNVTQHEPVVWYGAGAQWNESGVKHGHYNNILFTVYSPHKKGWYFNGAMTALYLAQNGAGNNDTRIIRFKKSEVEYIYGTNQ